ncbi:MAG TPA: alternative ribosome rescue aminoacyl-tRNA hydrolase ArfB [Jiangellaceae bacterium]|nr:alternative ribosome rescue aminoacyl-tRNA hydrolase ArfB [Jiangellaceae bacterium]
MPGPLHVDGLAVIPEDELNWRFSRAGGPGGQSVNTTDSRVELSYDVLRSRVWTDEQRARLLSRLSKRVVGGVVTVTAAEHRSQLRNREAAEDRLVQMLTTALAPPARRRRPTSPSRAAQARRVEAKKQRGRTKRLRRRPDDSG